MMFHLKEMLSKCGLSAFSVSVFHHAVVLLLLTDCCKGQSQVVGPSKPVIVTVGDDVILPCNLKPATDAVSMTLEWARPDLNPRFVHVWHEGKDLQDNQHPSYKGRTSLSIERLKHGDVSLNISKVNLSDNGKYRCYLPDLDKDSFVQLVVGAASSSAISFAGIDTSVSGVVLQCESKGWHPEPEVIWLDSEGNLLSAEPTETVRGPDGLYTVSSRVTVEKRHNNNFTCRVQQNNINQTRETNIIVPGDFFIAPSNSAARITVSLAACFLCVLAVVFVVWKWRQNETKNKMITQREGQQLIGYINMVDTLKEQEQQLKNQRDELTSHKNKIEKLVEEKENLFNSVEKEITEKEDKSFISAPEYLKLKDIISGYKWNLNERVKELDKLEMNTYVPSSLEAKSGQSSFDVSSCMPMALACGLAGLAVGLAVTTLTGRGKSSLFKVQKNDAERDGIRLVVTTLKHQKREPEDQKDQLKGELEQVKAE
ncbi:butyrophilin subfamily 3 member A2-like [Scomber japonicus]|uniref:butyrophilin subfamily 3 member A2-like n=1 Tax=Scomber japonicus TaxID=13676 RepID=UPI00230674C3|nr:butyrophilin subfamily 3 member A2-like [Scomber japonicus]